MIHAGSLGVSIDREKGDQRVELINLYIWSAATKQFPGLFSFRYPEGGLRSWSVSAEP